MNNTIQKNFIKKIVKQYIKAKEAENSKRLIRATNIGDIEEIKKCNAKFNELVLDKAEIKNGNATFKIMSLACQYNFLQKIKKLKSKHVSKGLKQCNLPKNLKFYSIHELCSEYKELVEMAMSNHS